MTETARAAPRLFGVYGASGCGRAIMPVAEMMLRRQGNHSNCELVFVDDAPQARLVNGRRVLTYAEFVSQQAPPRAVCIAIANSQTRQRLAERCLADRLDSFSIVAPNALVMDDVQIGEGAIIAPFVTLTANIRIGRYFHANLYSYVEHDCVIGDFVTFGPGVHCNGNVVIEDHAYLGAGCVLRQGRPDAPLLIGRHAVVGMGAVVTKDVAPGTTVAGNPARLLGMDQ